MLLIISIPSGIYAQTNLNNNQETITLTLEDCYALLDKNNLELQLADKKIEIYQNKYADAMDLALQAESKGSPNESTNYTYRKQEKLNWQLALLDLDNMKNDKKDLVNNIKAQTKQKYVNILLLQSDLKILSDEITTIDKKLNDVKAKIQVGQAKELDYKSLLSQKLALQSQYNSVNKQIVSTLLSLKKDLGISLNKNVVLVEMVLPYVNVIEDNLDDRIAKVVDSSYQIQKQQKQLELSKLEKDLLMTYTDYRYSKDYFDLTTEINELEKQLQFDRNTLEADIRLEYLDLLTLKDNITLEELSLEIEKQNYDTIAAKAKLKMVDAATESSARISYNSQKNSYQRAMYNYILAAEQFNEKLGVQQ